MLYRGQKYSLFSIQEKYWCWNILNTNTNDAVVILRISFWMNSKLSCWGASVQVNGDEILGIEMRRIRTKTLVRLWCHSKCRKHLVTMNYDHGHNWQDVTRDQSDRVTTPSIRSLTLDIQFRNLWRDSSQWWKWR